jgi:hypothetical protein
MINFQGLEWNPVKEKLRSPTRVFFTALITREERKPHPVMPGN